MERRQVGGKKFYIARKRKRPPEKSAEDEPYDAAAAATADNATSLRVVTSHTAAQFEFLDDAPEAVRSCIHTFRCIICLFKLTRSRTAFSQTIIRR